MRTHSKYLACVGIITVLMPFFGIPSSWKDIFYVFAGLSVLLVSLLFLRPRGRRQNEMVSVSESTKKLNVSKK